MGLPVVSWQDSWVSSLAVFPTLVPSFSHSLPFIVIAIANQKCTNLIILRSTARHRNAVTPIFPVPLLVCKTAKIHMPHSRFRRILDNGHIHQKMQRPIPAPREAIVCVGFPTWSINWTVSGGEITRIGWQRRAMKSTTCSLIQRFVANYGKIRSQLRIFVTARTLSQHTHSCSNYISSRKMKVSWAWFKLSRYSERRESRGRRRSLVRGPLSIGKLLLSRFRSE